MSATNGSAEMDNADSDSNVPHVLVSTRITKPTGLVSLNGDGQLLNYPNVLVPNATIFLTEERIGQVNKNPGLEQIVYRPDHN
jgi:hypothetical protein